MNMNCKKSSKKFFFYSKKSCNFAPMIYCLFFQTQKYKKLYQLMNANVRNIWENCLSFIKDNVTDEVFEVWFKPIEPVELNSDNTLVIMVPSMFFMEWLEDHYIDLIWSALTKELGTRPKLIYNIKMENNPNKVEQATEQLPSTNRKSKTDVGGLGYGQKPQEPFSPYAVPGIKEVEVDSQLNPNKKF